MYEGNVTKLNELVQMICTGCLKSLCTFCFGQYILSINQDYHTPNTYFEKFRKIRYNYNVYLSKLSDFRKSYDVVNVFWDFFFDLFDHDKKQTSYWSSWF